MGLCIDCQSFEDGCELCRSNKRIAELEAENKCLAEIRREVINTAIGWQDEENCCPSECNHTEVCAEEILNLVMPKVTEAK